ncbi:MULTISPECIES: FAD-dependent monooxygenase, partial [unclassified Nocardiopsis]
MERRIPVLVVGGGLVGLSAALFLGSHGVRTVLVERRESISRLPRGRSLSIRTMELFRSVGLEEELRSTPPSVLRDLDVIIQAESLSGPEVFRTTRPKKAGFADLSPTSPVTVDQNEVERVLLRNVLADGHELLSRTEVESLTEAPGGVRAELVDRETGRRTALVARYVIAADGHRSRTRDALGIGTSGIGNLCRYVNIPFTCDLSDALNGRSVALAYLDRPARNTMLTRLDGPDRWILMVPLDPDGAPPLTGERCADLVRAAVGSESVDPVILDDFLDRRRRLPEWDLSSWVADQYSSGRVLLAGDAAHVMPPAGGLGGNVGVQDAHNLAWKLALVLRGEAAPSLLDTYEQERRPVAEWTNEYSADRQLSRHDGKRGRGPVPDSLSIELGYRYLSDAVCDEPGDYDDLPALSHLGSPGGRAPHVALTRDGAVVSTLDLYRRSFVLVAGPRGHAWIHAARAVDAGTPLDLVHVGHDVGDLPGREGDWVRAHGVTESGALLVRPDGFVCWRAKDDLTASHQEVLSEALSRVLGAGAAAPTEPGT